MTLKSKKIIIKPEFKEFLVPLSPEEFENLEKTILTDGCLTPLIVWKQENEQILIDGHNRYNICTKHNISFDIEVKEFSNEHDVKLWMITNQLGRRNLSSDQASYYRGMRYLQQKNNKGGYDKIIKKGDIESSTAKLLANEFNVSESTIKRDAKYAMGIEIIGKSNSKLKLQILQGNSSIKKKDIQFLSTITGSPKFKNEADLFNKIHHLKSDQINALEEKLIETEEKLSEEEIFPDFEGRVKRIKALVISNMNKAIEKKDLQSIKKIRAIIDELEKLISD